MRIIRKYRLVCACLNVLAGIIRLIAVIVDMASYYPGVCGKEVGQQVPT